MDKMFGNYLEELDVDMNQKKSNLEKKFQLLEKDYQRINQLQEQVRIKSFLVNVRFNEKERN